MGKGESEKGTVGLAMAGGCPCQQGRRSHGRRHTGPVTARPTSIAGGWVFQRARVVEPLRGALQALEDRPADAKTRQSEFREHGDEFESCGSGPAVLT